MQKNRIVAFTGLAHSGKSTAAEHLLAHGYTLVAFASPIKDMIRVVWPQCTDKDMHYEELGGKTLRQAYQTLGTEWGRMLIHPDIWARHLLRSLDPARRYVVEDLRFTNEARVLKENGALIVEIRRPGVTAMEHASEAGIDPLYVDEVIENNGTPEELWAKLSFLR